MMPTALETRHTMASERLEVVGELATLINTTFDLEEIFQAAITKLQRVMMFRRASVALVSEEGDHYELHTLFDAERDGFIEGRGRFPLAQGLTGEVIRTGEPLLVPDLPGTEGIRLPNESALSAIIVPLHVDGEIIGALNFGSKESERYGQEDLELAALLARQIETSLHYSKLLSTIESQRERLALQNAKVLSERTRLKALIEASDAAILMVADGRVVHANRALADLIGMPWEVVMGSPVAQVNQAFARCLSEPNDLSSQVAALDAEAEPLRDRVEFAFPQKSVCQRTVVPVVDQRSMLGHLILYRDITREAAAEEAKDEFVSIVSHELRTPLTSVKTSLGLIKNGAAGDLPRAMWEFVDIALRNLDRLVRLVDDLLQMSRMQSGRFEFELAPVSLEGAVARAVEAVSGFARDRGVEIESDGDRAATVLAARDPLEQVIVNLLSNGIKFSPPDAPVTVQWRVDDESAVVEIADRGPGIPADRREVIFEKFMQLERSATRTHGGAGLGLAISKNIVEGLGGRLWVEGEEGAGSRFLVELKLVPDGEQRSAPAAAA